MFVSSTPCFPQAIGRPSVRKQNAQGVRRPTMLRAEGDAGEKKTGTRVNDPDYVPGDPTTENDSRKASRQSVTVNEVIAQNTSAFLKSMPGGTAPMGDAWDPFGLSNGKDVNTIKRYREAELAHGRVCMLASVGILVGENAPILNDVFTGGIEGPAIDHWQQIKRPFWELIVFGIGLAETTRAQIGWCPPNESLFQLRESYNPGDVGWDPLNLRPSEPDALTERQNKEINNGRLAMIGTAGMVVQELIDGRNVLPLHGGMLGN